MVGLTPGWCAQSTPEGLDDSQVAERLKEYGPNKLPENSRSPILQFLGYLWNPLSWAMEAAAIIAIVLLDYADFALILFLLLLNAVISFREEASAVRPPCSCAVCGVRDAAGLLSFLPQAVCKKAGSQATSSYM